MPNYYEDSPRPTVPPPAAAAPASSARSPRGREREDWSRGWTRMNADEEMNLVERAFHE